MKPRLLVITTTFPRWKDDPGPAPFVLHHARGLARHFEVTVLAPHFEGAAEREEMDGVQVRRFRYAVPDRLELLSDGAGIRSHLRRGIGRRLLAGPLVFFEWMAIMREVRRTRPDFINSHWLVPSGLLACLAPGARRLPHLITVHAADYDLLMKLPAGKTLIRFMASRARALVCVSGRLGDGIKKLAPGARVVIQPMGVELERFRFDETAREKWRSRLGAVGPVVLFAGKLSPKKGVAVLLRAAAILRGEGKAVQVVIAGEGELRPELTRLAEELGLGEAVNFLGALPNSELAGLYSAAEAVALPSVMDPAGETEGMPVVALEALAAGRPVIATTLCSVPADLKGRGAIEVEPGDDKALADALKTALGGGVEVDEEAVKKYNVQQVAETYARLFKNNQK